MKRRFETLEELEAYENESREAWIALREAVIAAFYLREIALALNNFILKIYKPKES